MDINRFAVENKADFKSCGNQYFKKAINHTLRKMHKEPVQWK